MHKQISFRQYRAIDLSIMTGLLILSQSLISIVAATIYADQLYVGSTVGAVTALVMMRWNGYAAIPAFLGGLLFTFLSGGTLQHYLIYSLGNLLTLLALILFKLMGKEAIRTDGLMNMFFAFTVQILMQLGRAGVAFLFGNPAGVCLGFITTDALSILFTVCVIWVTRRIEGLFEDQKKYLLRIQKERQTEGREQL